MLIKSERMYGFANIPEKCFGPVYIYDNNEEKLIDAIPDHRILMIELSFKDIGNRQQNIITEYAAVGFI